MEENQWMKIVNEELGRLPYTSEESAHWSKQSIYRIPASVTAINPTAYTPYLVSIGPYHHGSDNTKPMEKHKHRAFLHFLERSKMPIHAFWDALAPVAQDLKEAYDELSPEWQDDTHKFLQLMIIDGCFILEILRSSTTLTNAPPPPSEAQPSIVRDYAPNDPIFSRHGKLYFVPHLRRDMMMLENQLPLLVLQKLLAVQTGQPFEEYDLTKLILGFFGNFIPTRNMTEFNHCNHMLEIFRKRFLLEEHKVRGPSSRHIHGVDIIHPVKNLVAGGIKIKRNKTSSIKDIFFDSVYRVLKLPQISLDESSESVYLNQMAFERFHVGAGNEVTSFVFFMNNMIGSSSDVTILQNYGIIENFIGSEDDVAKLFQSLTKGITPDPENSLDEVHRQIGEYCSKPWSQLRTEIINTYFTDPWAITAAAILLFVLTILQTIFSVLAYTNPR
ncbi:UPF0481 protein At3g47200-like [Salvia hispanica]|uniref:UPF0481 protein At3g47200-like n=1 Tax=Salvia hispanica TaxID=49212 RepID=UPI002008FFAB|nr:UPF0481 protein At3g47200-like [Salvia hispanica]